MMIRVFYCTEINYLRWPLLCGTLRCDCDMHGDNTKFFRLWTAAGGPIHVCLLVVWNTDMQSIAICLYDV